MIALSVLELQGSLARDGGQVALRHQRYHSASELMVCHPLCEVALAETPLCAHFESRQLFALSQTCDRSPVESQQVSGLFESQNLFFHERTQK
jgi:hypothetical protein